MWTEIVLLCLAGLLMVCHPIQATTKDNKFANRSVWGTMIVSDPKIATLLGYGKRYLEKMKMESTHLRRKLAEQTITSLPFPIVAWPSMYAQDCPGRGPRAHPAHGARGCDVSHHQIWADWEYQGRLGVDKAIALDSDVLVVFEDDAVITVKNITHSLEQVLSPSNMRSDMTLLGWCYVGDNVSNDIMPYCTHAYAVTRAWVRKVLDAWDICSPVPLDNDMIALASKGVFTWQKAHPESYADRLEEYRNLSNHNNGIFVQKKGMVSVNSRDGRRGR